jgi:hypothetical protein
MKNKNAVFVLYSSIVCVVKILLQKEALWMPKLLSKIKVYLSTCGSCLLILATWEAKIKRITFPG